MANWIELPAERFLNLDACSAIFLERRTNPVENWCVVVTATHGKETIYADHDPDKAEKVLRAIMRHVHYEYYGQPDEIPKVQTHFNMVTDDKDE